MRRHLWFLLLALGAAPAQALPRAVAPEFAVRTIDGQAVRLSALRGQGVIVLFGDVHCAACRANDALLRRYQYAYADRPLTVLSLHEHASDAEVRRYDAPYAFAVLTGRDPGAAAARRYGVRGAPTTVFIDPAGRILAERQGLLDEADLVRLVARLLGGG